MRPPERRHGAARLLLVGQGNQGPAHTGPHLDQAAELASAHPGS